MSFTPSASPHYVGRFAPSPTGPLHFGSLVAAVGSYCDARTQGGRWLVRIEDVDQPRCVKGAVHSILATLERFALYWDGEIVYQSQRDSRYEDALTCLLADDKAFPCGCTRKELAGAARAADGSRIYPGTCRPGLPPGRTARAWRARVNDGSISFEDLFQGAHRENLATDVGDFVIRRADGLFAYQLAVVVDDADAGVTHVIRGADLLSSTCRQIHLQRLLGIPSPFYGHLPVAIDGAGEKLSKQTLARAVDELPAQLSLLHALRFLGQTPPDDLADGSIQDMLRWACLNWRRAQVPQTAAQPAPSLMNARANT